MWKAQQKHFKPHSSTQHCAPREMALELGCLAWAGTADLVVFRDDAVIDRTEPGGGKKNHIQILCIQYTKFVCRDGPIAMPVFKNNDLAGRLYLFTSSGN